MSYGDTKRVPMVGPPTAIVIRGIVPLRTEPHADSELVDELQFGETVAVLGERGDWRYVQGPDLYFGWCEAGYLDVVIDIRGSVIGVPLAIVRAAQSHDAPQVDVLPVGAPFEPDEEDSPYVRIVSQGGRWVDVADITLISEIPHRYPTPDDLVATAEWFLGVPYLWGGTSAHGIDCSGLTQRVYFLNGVRLDRDADQQALGGRPVDVARPGDLFFFGAERVTHTAIATGERTFIHAPQSGKSVQRGDLADMSRLRATRRYLP